MPLLCLRDEIRCIAKCKARQARCFNLAAYGMRVCHKHGARKKETITRGKDHPNFKHGETTQEAHAECDRRLRELRDIEQLMVAIGVHTGGLMRGRKPKL